MLEELQNVLEELQSVLEELHSVLEELQSVLEERQIQTLLQEKHCPTRKHCPAETSTLSGENCT